MKANEIFENLVKIEPKVVSIETLFNNEETMKNTKYDPDYQRKMMIFMSKGPQDASGKSGGGQISPAGMAQNGGPPMARPVDSRQTEFNQQSQEGANDSQSMNQWVY